MSCKQKFLLCKLCGNLTELLLDSGVAMVCCGEEMTELVPNTVDASVEKHLPVVSKEGNNIGVQVGSVPHPMEKEHHIAFVCVKTECGIVQRCCLEVDNKPKVQFCACDCKVVAAYAYCNLHGLWKTEI